MDELLKEIKADQHSRITVGIEDEYLDELAQELGAPLPLSYRAFMREIDGGYFRFGQLYSISSDGACGVNLFPRWNSLKEHYSHVREGKYIPIGDDDGPCVYCLDVSEFDGTECPVVSFYSDEPEDSIESEYVADSFAEFVRKLFNESLESERNLRTFEVAFEVKDCARSFPHNELLYRHRVDFTVVDQLPEEFDTEFFRRDQKGRPFKTWFTYDSQIGLRLELYDANDKKLTLGSRGIGRTRLCFRPEENAAKLVVHLEIDIRDFGCQSCDAGYEQTERQADGQMLCRKCADDPEKLR